MLFLLSVFVPASSLASVNFRAAASAGSTSTGITFVAAGAATSAASGNRTPALPAGIQDGDLIVCLVESYDNVAHTTATAGWSQLYSLMGASATHRASLFYTIADATTTALTVTHTGGSSIIARCAAYRGVDTTTPFDVAYAAQYSASDTTVETGSLTTVNNNDMLLFAGHIANRSSGGTPLTVAGGLTWTERIDSNFNGGGAADIALWLFDATQATAGAIGPLQETGSLAGVSHGVLIALRGNPTPLTINVPTGTVAGDVMIASVTWTPSATTVNAPSGWTLIREVTQGSATTSRLATYYRVATASEPSAYTWTFSGSVLTQSAGGILSFSGVDNAAPVDAEAGNATNSSLNHTAPTVTTTLDDGMLVTIHELASSATWTPPGTMTEAADDASLTPNNAAGISIEMNYEVRTTAGATGTRQATASANADRGATQSVSLKPTPLICYTDDFNRADGSPGTGWTVSNSGGTFGNPVIVSNRLRLTDASGNAATMATLQRLFPGSGNRIEVEFEHYAYGGSGADGIAIALSDSSVTPTPGGYGGSLGYAQNTNATPAKNGFGGGWLGIGIDEYGNFSSPTEGRVGGPGLVIDTISIRGSGSGTAGYAYHTGTATLVPQVDNNGAASPAHKYRIIVDHSNGVNALVSVERNTGSGYVTLIAPYDAKAQAGQAAVPTGWMLSYTGSTGGSTNIHEIDGLRICATSQSPISGVDHFDITVAASASTCVPHTVTIVAKDASNAILTGYTGSVTLSTSTAHGTWAKATSAPIPQGTLTPGSDNGAASYTFVAGDNGSIVLTLDNQRAENLTTTVVDSIAPASSTTSGTVSYLDNAFVISPTDALGTTVVAGRDHAMKAELWRCTRVNPTTCNTCSIAPGYGGAKNLDAWYTADTDHPAGASAPAIGALTLPASAPAVNPASNNLTTLGFTNGVANFNLTTSDVGKYTLNLRDDTGSFASAVNIASSSSIFTVRPFALHVDVPGNPGASAAGGSIFTSAGTDFTATVRGVLWQAGDDANDDGVPDSGAVLSNNGVTPRYAWDTALGAVAPYTPAAGVLGSTSNGTVLQASFSGGSATVNNLRYSEVGSFTIRGAASNYLNSGINLQTDNGVVGRFTPAYFDVAVTAACGPVGTKFTYSGQPLSMVTVTAKAANLGTTTQNYDGTLGFAKDVVLSNAGDASNFTNNSIAAAGFGSGIRNQAGVTYTFPAKETVPVTLTLRAVDNDTVSVSSAGHTEEPAEIRSGRIHILNAYGSELVSLSVPMRVEYYSSDGWMTNTNDTCTSVLATTLSLSNNTAPTPVSPPTAKTVGTKTTLATVANSPFASGDAGLSFSAPGAGGEGYVDVTPDLSAKTWLRYDWDDNSSEDDPTGRATFGLYRGSPKHIYQRQRY
ncbi:MAG: hypothetical protein Tsb0026_15780 [Sulfuricaulis sp.]